MKVAKTFSFDASHCLPNYPGKCARDHGHTWRLEVVVEGKVAPKTGMVVDFNEVKKVINRVMYDNDPKWDLDHNCLNNVLPVPTAENLVRYILRLIRAAWWDQNLPGQVVTLRLWEKYVVQESWAEVDWEEAEEWVC